jgi:DNA-binding NtrC family response regulator
MRRLLRDLDIISRADASVLIEGETGVGKSLVARTLHLGGPRAAQPFVSLNAANVSEELFESELFGHVKGAFSGAYEHHKGLARAADRGTLFLDEIGELKPSCQAKLLSLLDHQEVRSVGGLRPIKVDLRVISATHRNLRELIRRQAFRRDLYYRLRVVSLRVPSLRERRDDIPLLAAHFLDKLGRKYDKETAGFSEAALAALQAHHWEGNVRELENEIERAVILTPDGEEIHPQTFSLIGELDDPDGPAATVTPLKASRQAAESRLIQNTLQSHRWNVSAAARSLGISRVGLTRKLKLLGIHRPGMEPDQALESCS